MSLTRQLRTAHEVLVLTYSPAASADRLLLLAGLLDGTAQVLYEDSLKFFLSLYGHKLPLLCAAVSYDSQLVVTGSADKTVKIWGLDFGDCHRCVRSYSFTNPRTPAAVISPATLAGRCWRTRTA